MHYWLYSIPCASVWIEPNPSPSGNFPRHPYHHINSLWAPSVTLDSIIAQTTGVILCSVCQGKSLSLSCIILSVPLTVTVQRVLVPHLFCGLLIMGDPVRAPQAKALIDCQSFCLWHQTSRYPAATFSCTGYVIYARTEELVNNLEVHKGITFLGWLLPTMILLINEKYPREPCTAAQGSRGHRTRESMSGAVAGSRSSEWSQAWDRPSPGPVPSMASMCEVGLLGVVLRSMERRQP